jgi:hypothetical protein
VDRRDLDILVIPPAIGLFVFDPHVREMDLVIEVGDVVVVRPFLDLVSRAIGPPISVVAVPISLVQPLLVLPLELVVEHNSVDAGPALGETPGLPEVRAIHLGVVFHLARLLQIGVELLTMVTLTVVAIVERMVAAIRLQHVPTFLRQDDRHVPMTGQALGSDEPLLAEVSEVARPWIGRTLVVVAKVACRDDPKRADGRQRAGFRAPQGVLAVPSIVDDLSVRPTRQVKLPHEHVPRIVAFVSMARAAVALDPLRVIVAFSGVVFRVVVSRTG